MLRPSMPSFTRRQPLPTRPAPPGTHPSPSTPNLHLLPTGLPSLDDLLGGGLPLGSTLLVLAPDSHSAWGRLVERYWVAQGLVTGQRGVCIGEEGEVRDVVRGCMWVEGNPGRDKGGRGGGAGAGKQGGTGGSESEGEGVGPGEGRGGGKIAWRYEGMKSFQTTVAGSGPGEFFGLVCEVLMRKGKS